MYQPHRAARRPFEARRTRTMACGLAARFLAQPPVQQMPDYPTPRPWPRSKANSRATRRWSSRRGALAAGAPAEVCAGNAFLLQGGDCAEAFADFQADKIRTRCASSCRWRSCSPSAAACRGEDGPHRRPVREAPLVQHGGDRRHVPAQLPRRHRQRHRVRAGRPPARPRAPAPGLLRGRRYAQPAPRLHQGGYASLTRVHQWTLGFLDRSPQGERYRDVAHRITEALESMEACGVTDLTTPRSTAPLYTSHEALLLGSNRR